MRTGNEMMGKKILSLDALMLLVLVLVRVRIDTLVTALIPRPTDLVAKIPVPGGLFSPDALRLLADWQADPISLLLITATFGLVVVYLGLDVLANWPRQESTDRPWSERRFYQLKLVTLYLIIFLATGVGTLLVIELRHVSEPARYAHDGGVLITESAIDYLLQGKNPYVETYRGTSAEKAYPNGPGLSHYAYLPLAFLSGIPFYLLGHAAIGWYDQRFLYLLALALTLALAPKLASSYGNKLALVMLVGLNPILGNDIVYGMNDMLVVFLLVLAAYLARTGRETLSVCSIGLAVATKGTVWPIVPFYFLYLFRNDLKALRNLYLAPLTKLIPFAVSALVVLLPFALWNFGAMVEDVWSYNMGSTPIDPLPIKGWGLANIVLAFGWVKDTMDYFPFWVFEALFALPILVLLLLRQRQRNGFDSMLMSYGLFTLVFVYFSRTMNPNYIGYALTLVALGYFGDHSPQKLELDMVE